MGHTPRKSTTPVGPCREGTRGIQVSLGPRPSQRSGERKSGRVVVSTCPQQTAECLTDLYPSLMHHLSVTSSGKPFCTPKTRSEPLLYILEHLVPLPHSIDHIDNYFLSIPLDCKPKEARGQICPLTSQHT